jgi:hypothetical protein
VATVAVTPSSPTIGVNGTVRMAANCLVVQSRGKHLPAARQP